MVSARKYVKTKQIGKGAFGSVWLVRLSSATSIKTPQYCMKEISLKGMPASGKQATMNEVKLLRQMRHPHIVSFKDSFVMDDMLCIVMEWASGGDLGEVISSHKRSCKHLSEADVIKYLHQICTALAYVHHDLKLLHRDLKPANIFLSSDGDVKLGDFGISRQCTTMDMARTMCGTPLYLAPEQARGQPYSRSADVWAIGCILYELMSLNPPWIGQMGPNGPPGGMAGLMRKISTETLDTAALRRSYSPALCNLLDTLLETSPIKRPTLQAVIALPIFGHLVHPTASPEVQDEAESVCEATENTSPHVARLERPAPAPPEDKPGLKPSHAAAVLQRSFRRRAQPSERGIGPTSAGRKPSVFKRPPSAGTAKPSVLKRPPSAGTPKLTDVEPNIAPTATPISISKAAVNSAPRVAANKPKTRVVEERSSGSRCEMKCANKAAVEVRSEETAAVLIQDRFRTSLNRKHANVAAGLPSAVQRAALHRAAVMNEQQRHLAQRKHPATPLTAHSHVAPPAPSRTPLYGPPLPQQQRPTSAASRGIARPNHAQPHYALPRGISAAASGPRGAIGGKNHEVIRRPLAVRQVAIVR